VVVVIITLNIGTKILYLDTVQLNADTDPILYLDTVQLNADTHPIFSQYSASKNCNQILHTCGTCSSPEV
jgi:hypothetical protein